MKKVVSSVLASAALLTPFLSPLSAQAAVPPTAYAVLWNRLPQTSLPATPLYRSQMGALKQVHNDPRPEKLTIIVDSSQRVAQLQSYARAVNTPGSPLFHHFLTPKQVDARFGPTKTLMSQARAAIKDAGWKILGESAFSMEVATGNPQSFKIPVTSALYAVAGLNPVHIQPASQHRGVSHRLQPLNTLGVTVNATSTAPLSVNNFRQSPTQSSVTTAANGDIFRVMSFNPGITSPLPSGLPFNLVISAQTPSGTPLAIQSVQSISDTLNNIGYYGEGQPFPGSQGTLWQLGLVGFGPTQKADTLSAQVTLANGTRSTVSFSLPPFTGTATALFPLNGSEISQLLGAQSLYQAALKQAAAPIAIFSLGQAPSLSDLSTLMNQEGLPMPHLQIQYQDGAQPGSTDAATALESNLDVQAVSSVAPSAPITDEIYPTSAADPLLSFLTMLSQQSTIKIATVSYGFSGENVAVLSTLVDACTAEGITLVFASGDQGAYGGTGGQLGVPSTDSQPGILTVGGLDMAATATFNNAGTMTSLSGPTILKSWGGDYLNALPSPVLESYLQKNAASSGGFGSNPVPSWQQGHLPAGAPGIGVPDIASLAGMPAMQGIINGQPAQFGGTSLAAPLSAGWLADLEAVNQVQSSGMGNINPLLFQAASTHPSDFLQAQWGSNGYYQVTSSQDGSWNPVTGLGAPNWDQLASLWHPQSVKSVSLTPVVSSATVGSKVPFTLTALTANGNPDPYFTGPVTLSSSDPTAELPSSSQLHFSDGQAIFNVVFEQTGSQSVTVKDPLQTGLQVTSNPVNVTNPVTLSVTPSPATVGESVTMTANASVSSSGLQYQFWVKDPATQSWTNLGPYSTNSSIQFTPQVPGTYSIQVFVKGLSASSLVTNGSISVAAPTGKPMVSALSVSAPQIFQNPGTSVTFSAQATDPSGIPLYQYWVHGPNNRWTMVQNYSTNSRLTLKDLTSGSYAVAVYALDKNQYDHHAFSQAYYYTTVLNVGSQVSLTAPSTLPLGHVLALNATAHGLTNPVYQFWIKSPDGQWSQSGAYGGGTYQFTPSHSGTYTIVVFAKDPYAPATSQFAVTASQSVTVS